jgi:ferredoxin-NADP reductase
VAHGARNVAELGYRDELTALAGQGNGFVYLPLVTREPPGQRWTGCRGRVQSLFEGRHLDARRRCAADPATWHVFLCGNPAMNRRPGPSGLKARGFNHHRRTAPGNLHSSGTGNGGGRVPRGRGVG